MQASLAKHIRDAYIPIKKSSKAIAAVEDITVLRITLLYQQNNYTTNFQLVKFKI